VTTSTSESLKAVFARLCTACQTTDIPTVEICINTILAQLDLTSPKLAGIIGISNQTVTRWRRHHDPKSLTARPNEVHLVNIGKLVDEHIAKISYLQKPEGYSVAQLHAVAETTHRKPSYLEQLVAVERVLGAPLDKAACLAILHCLEEADSTRANARPRSRTRPEPEPDDHGNL
jgi:hypothetical protein